MTEAEKREILIDWLSQMDEQGLEELLIEYHEYSEEDFLKK